MASAEEQPPESIAPAPQDDAPSASLIAADDSRVLSAPVPRGGFFARFTPGIYALASALAIGIIALLASGLGQAVMLVGIASGALGLGAVVALVRGQGRQWPQWLLVGLALLALGVGGILGSNGATRLQVDLATAHGDYAAAVADLGQLGERPPHSQRLARTYLDWAQAEVKADAFAPAVDHLTTVATGFPTLPQAATAGSLLPEVYLHWAMYATTHHDPVQAGQAYQVILTHYAASPAAETAHAQAAATYLAWATALHDAHYYADADAVYQQIFTGFPQAPEATLARSPAAQNLLDWAQQLITAGIFDQAAQRFQELQQHYADTPAGKQALTLLNQGVRVTGQLLKADGKTPVHADTTVRLSSQWTVGATGIYQAHGQHYLANTDINGMFAFPAIPPGQYLLEWRGPTGEYRTLFQQGQPQLLIVVTAVHPPVLAAITTDQV